jgi:hypothetical protein
MEGIIFNYKAELSKMSPESPCIGVFTYRTKRTGILAEYGAKRKIFIQNTLFPFLDILLCIPGWFALKHKNEMMNERRSNMKHMVNELVQIGKTDGFLSTKPGGKFDENNRHIRAAQIGEKIFNQGGFQLMLEVCRAVYSQLGAQQATGLRFVWQGIGGEWDPYYVANLL